MSLIWEKEGIGSSNDPYSILNFLIDKDFLPPILHAAVLLDELRALRILLQPVGVLEVGETGHTSSTVTD